MAKSKKDLVRENRISDEAIVDAYGPEEQAMGWYYYLDNKSCFPFRAKCTASTIVSPRRKGETVELRRLASEDICVGDMLVLVRKHGPNIAVPLSLLTAIDADEATIEAISDWHYWLAQRYSFSSQPPPPWLTRLSRKDTDQRPTSGVQELVP